MKYIITTIALLTSIATAQDYSLSFDGVDDYAIITPFDNQGTNFTIEYWVKFNSFDGGGSNDKIFDGKFRFWIQKAGPYLDFNFSQSGPTISTDQWYHIAATSNDGVGTIYLDGELYNSASTGNNLDNDVHLILGKHTSSNNDYLTAIIDEVRLSNNVRYTGEFNVPTEELVVDQNTIGLWHFNEGSGTIGGDETGNNYNWDIHGASWSTDVPFTGSTITEEISAVVSVGETNAYVIDNMYTDTVFVPVMIDSLSEGISAGEFRFTGFQDGLEFLEVITDSSLLGVADWTIVSNDQDTLLITVGYGSTNIDTSGILFFLKTAVSDTMTEGIASIEIVEIELNESSDEITVHDGEINIFNPILGDVSENDDVSAFDASLILKYLVGTEELVYPQLLSADVTFDGEITALDASVIAQFVAELIDTLPNSDGALLAGTGNYGMDDGEFTPGEVLQVPIQLSNSSNLLSFEMELNFNPDILSYSNIEFSEMVNHFMVEENQMDGSLKLAGAGATPDGQEGIFATVSFIVGNDIENETIEIGINHYRTNENEIQDGFTAIFTNSTLATNPNLIPNVFALHQNYPNPFNPTTTLRYDLPEDAQVNIMIYDLMGREVKTLVHQQQIAGFKSVMWDATNNMGQPVSAGMYLYSIQAGNYSKTMKMVLLK